MFGRAALTGLACVAAAAFGCAAVAQTFTGTGALKSFVMPAPEAAPRPSGSEPQIRSSGPTPNVVAPPASSPEPPPASAASLASPLAPPPPRLRHLPTHPQGLRLAGESAWREWVITLTEAEAARAATFQVAYSAAISVSPETSTLSLSINDVPIGTTRIRPPTGSRLARFSIPSGLLVRGANAVRISVDQRHRVDCSAEATFELWTQFDPRETGLSLTFAGVIGDLADLAAAPLDPDGSTPISIVLSGRMSERDTERALTAAQLLTLLGRFRHATVVFGPRAERGSEGVDLAVGLPEALSATLDLSRLGPVEGPVVGVIPSDDARRPVLVVTGRDDRELDAAVAKLSDKLRAMRPLGSAPGLRALADVGGRRVAGGEKISLHDLGLGTTAFSGRSFRFGFDLRLPHDVLPADYGRLILDLAGDYAEGLAPGAQLRMEVNGGDAASLNLGKSKGDQFKHREVFLPLSRLRPGRNSIAITASLPMPADQACAEDPTARPRFSLSDGTELHIPALARVARLPDLTHAAVGAFPYLGGGRRATLHVPTPDKETMSAAATLAVRLAISAGEPVPLSFKATGSLGEGPTLIVAPARALDPGLLGRIGIVPEALRAAWETRAAAKHAGPTPLGLRRGTYGDAIPSCRAPAWGAAGLALAESGATPAPQPNKTGWRATLSRVMSALGLSAANARGAELTGSAEDFARASVLVAQGATGHPSDSLVTIVSAPNSELLREGVACLVDPRVWERLAGRLSLVDASDGAVRSVAAEHPRFVETQPFGIGNTRRIAAGYLSHNPELYALLALLIASCLAVTTRVLVSNVGRRLR